MGAEDMRRQAPNVERMNLLGAEVRPVEFGTKTLKEATSEAIRDWITNVETTHYLIGSCVGPAPYPEIVRDLQRVIGDEAREQLLAAEGRLPEVVVACVGGGSNAIGAFYAFLEDDVRLVGVEAAGAASLGTAAPGVLHGARSSILADADGQIADAHSISAGLDYPGVGPEHAALRDSGRAEYLPCTDEEALAAFHRLAETEGIIPALESSHALARALDLEEELISSACPAAATRTSPRCSPGERLARVRAAGPALPVDEAREVRREQRERGQHLDHRRAPRAARVREHVTRRRDERGRDRVVEEVREARRGRQPDERLVRMHAQSAT